MSGGTRRDREGAVTLFLCGDVMTGRGIDQVLPDSVDPRLREPQVRSARRYVQLARRAGAEIPDRIAPERVWGEALHELRRAAPEVRIANLETAVTDRGTPWPGKGIHYRMHPGNVEVLTAAGLDACVLANNHVLDWGREGLADTLSALRGAGIRTAGAGEDDGRARAPARLRAGGRRVLLFALASPTAGVPREWEAGEERPGVALLPDAGREAADRLAGRVGELRAPGDLVVVSLHWGSNWGYRIPDAHRDFARRLVDQGGADVVHGHSSHHPRGLEVYRGRPILYGCGDFLNDYEGIPGHEEYRPELALMFLLRFGDPGGRLSALEMVPMRIHGFRLHRASREDSRWLAERLDRESRRAGTRVRLRDDGRLEAGWGREG